MLEPFSKILIRCPLLSISDVKVMTLPLPDLFVEGLYLSSPELYYESEKISTTSEKNKAKLNFSLAKYYLRSCSRCTPYGTFAGSAILTIEDTKTEILLGNKNDYVKRIRIDMNY